MKEYYFYVDSTPTHSYMKYLYKYPQREFPYRDLVETNSRRSREEFEYELLDTGVFDDDRYFDVFVEYAKAGPEDVLVRITVHNRGPEAARLRVLPTLWFRNTWSWGDRRPASRRCAQAGAGAIEASHHELGTYVLRCDGTPELLFTENESNAERLWGQPNPTPYVKDAFHAYVVSGQHDAVNPAHTGTKAAAHYVLDVPAGGSQTVRLRLAAGRRRQGLRAISTQVFDGPPRRRRRVLRADHAGTRSTTTSGACTGRRWPACSGASSSTTSISSSGSANTTAIRCSSPARPGVRNTEWFHMLNADVISMPDKWEYPWYAAWDLAFHTIVAGARRLRLREGSAPADAAEPVLPPERPDSRRTSGTSAT